MTDGKQLLAAADAEDTLLAAKEGEDGLSDDEDPDLNTTSQTVVNPSFHDPAPVKSTAVGVKALPLKSRAVATGSRHIAPLKKKAIKSTANNLKFTFESQSNISSKPTR